MAFKIVGVNENSDFPTRVEDRLADKFASLASVGDLTVEVNAVSGEVDALTLRLATPQAFGATGDGATDDTAAWNAFQAATGMKFILPGSYKVNGTVLRFDNPVIGNGLFLDADAAWDQPVGDRERHAVLVHRNEISGNLDNIGPIVKTQTHSNLEVNSPVAGASFKHVIGAYHEGTLDGYYNIATDTNQNYTIFGAATRNRMAGLFGSLAGLFYVEDATEVENPRINTMGATKNGGIFIRMTRKAKHANGGYMFGLEIYAQNMAAETTAIPYQNSDYFNFEGAWTAGIKIGANGQGAPLSTALFTHGLTTKHGFWNGIVLGGSGFAINGNDQGYAGTVGLNLSSWRTAGGYGDIGIKFRTANRHLHFVEGAKVRSSHTRFMHELGPAGISIESQSGGTSYLNFRSGATGANDGGNVSDDAVIDASSSRLRLRGAAEVHLDAAGTTYAATTARFAPATSLNGSQHLGGADRRWNTVYAATGTISTSDERYKRDIKSIPDAALDAWENVNFEQFRYRDAVDTKGDDARYHTGVIAQRVKEAFEAKGLDATEYGLLCYDEWEATPEKVTEYEIVLKEAVYERVLVKEAEFTERENEDGTVERIESMPPEYEDGELLEPAEIETRRDVIPAQDAGSIYSVRYDEALVFEAAYQRRRADRIEERLSRLEALVTSR